ncbi:transcriptional activator of acetoin/glycerol metabolism, partial [Pseudomonas sp. GM84]|uniref:helix-turn-helix domain-containing protein n=1 Tax=Pseudomonas sp. GM84 TaxID=1144340 RepID=UPI00026F569D
GGAGLSREAGNAVDGTGFAGVRGASPLPHGYSTSLRDHEQNSRSHKSAPVRLEEAECVALLSVLEAKHWHLTRVAEHLGISRNTLYRKLRKHGIARGA